MARHISISDLSMTIMTVATVRGDEVELAGWYIFCVFFRPNEMVSCCSFLLDYIKSPD